MDKQGYCLIPLAKEDLPRKLEYTYQNVKTLNPYLFLYLSPLYDF